MFRKQYLGILLMIVVGLSACKKDGDVIDEPQEDPLKGIKALVEQRWDFDRFTHQETTNGVTTYDTVAGVMGDYFDFNSNGKVYAFWDGLADTTDHQLIDAKRIIYAGDTFGIIHLGATRFDLGKVAADSNTSSADTILLRR